MCEEDEIFGPEFFFSFLVVIGLHLRLISCFVRLRLRYLLTLLAIPCRIFDFFGRVLAYACLVVAESDAFGETRDPESSDSSFSAGRGTEVFGEVAGRVHVEEIGLVDVGVFLTCIHVDGWFAA